MATLTIPSVATFGFLLVSVIGVSASTPTGPGTICIGGEDPEGEPACAAGYVDEFNGGQLSMPNVFSTGACGVTVCGSTGTFERDGVMARDSDWYLLDLVGEEMEVTATLSSATPMALAFIDVSGPVGDVVSAYRIGSTLLSVSTCVPAGATYAVYVSPATVAGVACATQYRLTLDCAPCGPTGACCLGNGDCVEDLDFHACLALDIWQWAEGFTCDFVCGSGPPDICGPGAGSCFFGNGSPGCEIIACCESVCSFDPFCCDTEWDSICADYMNDGIVGCTLVSCCMPDQSCLDLTEERCAELGGSSPGVFSACSGPVCPPLASNDDCLGATVLPVPGLIRGTTFGQNAETLGPCGTSDGTGGGVWYEVTGTGAMLTLSLCEETSDGIADFDTRLRVYSGPCTDLVCVAGNDNAPMYCHAHSTVEFVAQFGVVYRVLVHGTGADEGYFTLAAIGPGACPGDVDGNGVVGFADILDIIAAWGTCFGCPEDVNGNGSVGFDDVLIVFGAWGPC